MSRVAQLNTAELKALVERGELDELEVLEALRNPFCTAEIAARVASTRQWLGAHVVRERLAAFPGLPYAAALNLLATLPWLGLLHVAQTPRTPPAVRRQAERRLVERVHHMSLGEKVALARMAHRPIFASLMASGDLPVLAALLDNRRVVENDILLLLNRPTTPREVIVAVFRHPRWGPSYQVRRVLAAHPDIPVPFALSLLVQLRRPDLEDLSRRPRTSDAVREGARSLLTRHQTAANASDDGTIAD